MKWMLAGVAALSLVGSGALAQPGNGNGGGNGGGNRSAVQTPAQGNDHANHANGGGNQRAEPGNGNGNGNGNRAERPQQAERGNGAARRLDNPVREVRAEVNRGRDEVRRTGGAIDAGRNAVARDRQDRGEWREAPLRYVYGRDDDRRERNNDDRRYVGLLNGCPPGLAAKHNGCQPSGQARKAGYYQRDGYDLGWWGLPRWDERVYRYDSGYLVRIGADGRIGSFIPLLGGALAVGNQWPDTYGYDRLSPYYSNYYDLGPSYRYADNVVYRLDPETSLISSIAALLTGDDFTVGQPVPQGYDVYNVPYSYRDQYADGPDAYYRYSDGYVYEVDPETQLIAAAIELLV